MLCGSDALPAAWCGSCTEGSRGADCVGRAWFVIADGAWNNRVRRGGGEA